MPLTDRQAIALAAAAILEIAGWTTNVAGLDALGPPDGTIKLTHETTAESDQVNARLLYYWYAFPLADIHSFPIPYRRELVIFVDSWDGPDDRAEELLLSALEQRPKGDPLYPRHDPQQVARELAVNIGVWHTELEILWYSVWSFVMIAIARVLLLFVIASAIRNRFRNKKRTARMREGLCWSCAYSRTDLPEHAVCPECGTAPTPPNS